jgi:PAS domain S-box-containing protein
MTQTIRVLIVEDSKSDAALAIRALEKARYAVEWQRVDTADDMRAAITTQKWDLVICDYSMPQFDAPSALTTLRESGLDIPFIVVSGNVGEDIAVAMMRSGAHDYLMKGNLARLGPAVARELIEVANRRCGREAVEALRAAEARFRAIYDHVAVGIMMIDNKGTIIHANAACEKMLGYSAAELQGRPYVQITHPLDVERTVEHTKLVTEGAADRDEYEKRYVTKDGVRVWVRVIFSVMRDDSRQPTYFIKLIEDITRRKRAEAHTRRTRAENAVVLERLRTLTDREREVLWLIIDGQASKVIAMELGASPKTIDVHRRRVMEKMHADSVAQLVQMMLPVRKMPEAAAGQPRD